MNKRKKEESLISKSLSIKDIYDLFTKEVFIPIIRHKRVVIDESVIPFGSKFQIKLENYTLENNPVEKMSLDADSVNQLVFDTARYESVNKAMMIIDSYIVALARDRLKKLADAGEHIENDDTTAVAKSSLLSTGTCNIENTVISLVKVA